MSGNAGNDEALIALGRRINAERNRRSMSQEALAEKAGCSPKAIRKLLKGEKTHGRILEEVCRFLEINPDELAPTKISDIDHGSYPLSNFADYVGSYFSYRRALRFPRNVLRSAFSIIWDNNERVLRFKEFQVYTSVETGEVVDRSQTGEVFFNNRAGLLHLLTKDRGALRLITISQFRLQNPTDLTMSGIVLTPTPRQYHYQPSAAAIIFEKVKLSEAEIKKGVGEIRNGDSNYSKWIAELTKVERHVVNFVLAPPPQDPLRPEGV